MINFDHVTKGNKKEHNPNQPKIPDHLYRLLIIGGSGSRKKNSLFNLISQRTDNDKIYLYTKDPYEAKYQFLIDKLESAGLTLFRMDFFGAPHGWARVSAFFHRKSSNFAV